MLLARLKTFPLCLKVKFMYSPTPTIVYTSATHCYYYCYSDLNDDLAKKHFELRSLESLTFAKWRALKEFFLVFRLLHFLFLYLNRQTDRRIDIESHLFVLISQ